MKISMTVNGDQHKREVEPRTLLVFFLREALGLTGTKVGCDTSSCGACTVLVDGESVKSCTVLAAQVDGASVTTIEGLAARAAAAGIAGDDGMHPVQSAFRECHAAQCGYCTAGMVMAGVSLVEHEANLDEEGVRTGLEGNLCRCTGYHNIVEAVLAASAQVSAGGSVALGASA